jgi:hypothetical protein
MLPGSADLAFRANVERWPQAHTPVAKRLAIDALIHDFHVNFGIDGRPVGENVIAGTKKVGGGCAPSVDDGREEKPGL